MGEWLQEQTAIFLSVPTHVFVKPHPAEYPLCSIPTPILFLDSSTVALHTVDLQLKVIFIHLLAGHQFIICVHQVDLPFPRVLTQLSSEP